MTEVQVRRSIRLFLLIFPAVATVPVAGFAEPMTFKLHPNYSRATFKTDAPLETVVGNTAAAGISGAMTVDPARPGQARGTVTVDMTKVKTGIDKRDADMLEKGYLDVAAADANRLVTFEVTGVEVQGVLEPGKEVPAKVHGTLSVKQKPITVVADARVTYITLTPEQLEAQKRFGFSADNVKVRAKLATTFSNHGMRVPQLLFLKVSNDIQIETDLTFVRQ